MNKVRTLYIHYSQAGAHKFLLMVSRISSNFSFIILPQLRTTSCAFHDTAASSFRNNTLLDCESKKKKKKKDS